MNHVALAGMCGFTNIGSAKNAWAKIKSKIIAHATEADNGDADANAIKTATPKSATKKRGRPPGVSADETPSKKAKAKPAKSSAKPLDDADDEEHLASKLAEDDGSVSPVKDEPSDGLM